MNSFYLILTWLIAIIFCVVEVQPNFIMSTGDHLESCTGKPFSSSRGHGKGFQFNLEITSPDQADGFLILNGVVNFKADVVQPWKVTFTSEQKIGDMWITESVVNFDDLCNEFNNPLSMYSSYLTPLKPCPLKKGVSRQ